jgi:hypothetical protein
MIPGMALQPLYICITEKKKKEYDSKSIYFSAFGFYLKNKNK